MSDVWMLRTGILIAGVLLIAAIFFFGRPRRPGQGRRVEGGRGDGSRVEPSIGAQIENELAANPDYNSDAVLQSEMNLLDGSTGVPASSSDLGRRTSEDFDKIVTLYIAARAGEVLHGPDIVVAAEKTGLSYGHMNVFHRLLEGHPERGPVFSVANIMKPGSFDMASIQSLETPAIAFFLTLPAPATALDAWEMMLPTAERMTELLDGVLLDEQRNALGRQRVQHLRDELRAYDRQHEAPPITRSPRW
ncbi:MAG TPA: cell division protein ZipA [Luteimonas sp.]|nr:cell division protein ZipA [Luteimonas sp.]